MHAVILHRDWSGSMGLIPTTGNLPHPGGAFSGNVLWLVDGDHSLIDALTWMDQLTDDAERVSNVSEVVKACQKRAIAKSRPVDFLALFGHGMSGYQSAGAGKRKENTGTRSLYYRRVSRPGESLLTGPAEQTLSGLNGVLADNAKIHLGGCNVGEGDDGTGLLTAVSKCLNNRAVQGFESAIYPWMGVAIGTLKVAVGDSVTTSFECLSL
jgi:hypothetical protein